MSLAGCRCRRAGRPADEDRMPVTMHPSLKLHRFGHAQHVSECVVVLVSCLKLQTLCSQKVCKSQKFQKKRTPKARETHEQYQRISEQFEGTTRKKTRVLRQITPESSSESSEKSLSQKFFGVPFLSLSAGHKRGCLNVEA